MVRKLFKQEFISYLRTLLPIYLVMLGVALLNRLIQFFEADNSGYNIIFTSSLIALAVAMICSLILTFVISVVRFYKNLFSGEGYLTFTLPVNTSSILITKLLSAMVVIFSALCFCILAILIATAGEVTVELFKAVKYLLNNLLQTYSPYGVLLIIEFVAFVISYVLYLVLLFYACMTIGQTAHKNRILAAVAVYFINYLISQIIGTFLVVMFTLFHTQLGFDKIIDYFNTNPNASTHILFIAMTVYYLIPCAIYYVITHFIVKRKLNLE